jgi:hypothetical protein
MFFARFSSSKPGTMAGLKRFIGKGGIFPATYGGSGTSDLLVYPVI